MTSIMKFSVVSLLWQTLNLVLGNSLQFQAIDLHGSRGGLFHDIAQFVIEQDGRFFDFPLPWLPLTLKKFLWLLDMSF